MLVGIKTDLGKVRKINQDNCLALDKKDWQLYLVADGMGGHKSGEIASYLAIKAVEKFFSTLNMADWEEKWQYYMNEAFKKANEDILTLSSNNKEHDGMGTTLTAALYKKDKLYIAHVGDSRLYLLVEGMLKKITRDHSLVEELVRQGEITPEQAVHHPQKNILLRALGSWNDFLVDVYQEDFKEGQIVLLATDGLTNLVTTEEIKEKIISLLPQAAAESLVDLANQRGGYDNITVLIVKNT